MEREIGNHNVRCWSDAWMEHGPELPEDYNPDAVVLWNPMWFTPKHFARVDEWAHTRRIPMIGVMGDWFSGLREGNPHRAGTRMVAARLDGIVIDYAGASTMRHIGYEGRIAPLKEILTYGRLKHLGADESNVLELDLKRERPIDVCYVGHRHPSHVVLRSYFLDAIKQHCETEGWTYFESSGVLFPDLEKVLMDSKIVFNYAVGSMPNCRVYEALAAGCALVTDAQCIGILPGTPAMVYIDREGARASVERFMDDEPLRRQYAAMGLNWAVKRSPTKTWTKIFDLIEDLVEETAT